MKNRIVLICLILFIGIFGLSAIEIFVPDKSIILKETFPDTIQRVMPSVVHVMCPQWQGSGFAITKDIICTARHVVDGVDYTITTNDGRKFHGIKAISHKKYDIGFIKIGSLGKIADKLGISSELIPVKFGSIKDCVLGEQIFIIGSPYGKINFNSVTLGIISGLDRNWESLSRYGDSYGWEIAFTTDSGAHPGNSGGPVFTMDGIVRGILVGGFSPVLNCSMPCDLFMDDIRVIETLFLMDKYKVEKEEVEKIRY